MEIIRSRGAVQPMPRNGATIPISALLIKENIDSINSKLFTPCHISIYSLACHGAYSQGNFICFSSRGGAMLESGAVFALPVLSSGASGYDASAHI